MKTKNIPIWLAAVMLVISACTSALPTPLQVASPMPTSTIPPSPTASPTKMTDPKNTPTPTATPAPLAILVTERPVGNAIPLKITNKIGRDYKQEDIPESLFFERVTWVTDIKFNYSGGHVLLSGASDGMRPLYVDDVLRIKVIHLDRTSDSFEHDFSKDSPHPNGAGPYDLTDFFHVGLNMLYVEIYDYGYSAWGTEGLWIVEFR